MRKNTFSGGSGLGSRIALGAGGGGAVTAAAASSSSSSSSTPAASRAASFASAASRSARFLASIWIRVCSSGRIAGCRSANSTPHETPNLIVAGDTILKIVLTTTPRTILMKNLVTTSTYTSAHASASMTTSTPAVTLGSSQDNTPATRSAQLAASSRMFCDIVIMA